MKMAKKKMGLSSKCLQAIIDYAESAADYESNMHSCKYHKDKKACNRAEIINKKVTGPLIDNLFNQCRI